MKTTEMQRIRTAEKHGWRIVATQRGGAVLQRTLRNGKVVQLLTHQFMPTRVY